MTYKSLLPRWLKIGFTIPISLTLALLATMACGGDNKSDAPHTTLSQDAGITGLEISKGALTPAFKTNIRNYGATLYSNTPAINLTVTVLDEKSRLTINGAPAISGQAAPVALHDGANTINIVTVSEDGRNSDVTTLTVNKIKPSTKVWVLSGLGDSPIENAVITLKDANNRLLEDNISLPPNKNGTLALGLDSGMKYNIYAKGKDSAQALYANFDPSRESDAVLYCLPQHGGDVFPAEAPIITDISFSPNQSDPWTRLYNSGNHIAGPRADVANVRITAIAKCSIIETSWGPPPIGIGLDTRADFYNDETEPSLMQAQIPRGFDGQLYYETIYCFTVNLAESNALSEKDHWIDIVVYDMANNRTEQRVYLTITDAAASMDSDDDISEITPELFLLHGETYGVSRNLPAINPIDDHGAMYFTLLEFRVDARLLTYRDVYVNTLSFLKIRGYEIYRSTDNINFEKIDVRHFYYSDGYKMEFDDYSSPDQWDWLLYQLFYYTDQTYGMSDGPLYYKIRAFNGNPANGGFSKFSNVMRVTPLPPFTSEMTSPEHNAISDKVYPAFRFDVSNPALLGSELADLFYFTLYLKNITDNYPIFNVRFLVDFTQLDEEGNPLIGHFRHYDDGPEGPGLYWTSAVYDSGERDSNGNPIYLPFAWIEGDSTFVIDTDNYGFQSGADVFAELLPGDTYEWNIFGQIGGIASDNSVNQALFYKGYTVPQGLPVFAVAEAFSFGSISNYYGLGAINGFFTLTIDPDAK